MCPHYPHYTNEFEFPTNRPEAEEMPISIGDSSVPNGLARGRCLPTAAAENQIMQGRYRLGIFPRLQQAGPYSVIRARPYQITTFHNVI